MMRSELIRMAFDAVQSNDQARLQQLLRQYPDALQLRDFRKDSLLHAAAQFGDVPLMAFLVEAGLDININRRGIDGAYTPLHVAAEAGRMESTRWLIEQGAEVDVGAGVSATPLAGAAMSGHVQIVHLLLASGADIGAHYYLGEGEDREMFDALKLAQMREHDDVLQVLIGALLSSVPGWRFRISEVSNGVWRAEGTDEAGHVVSCTGTDEVDIRRQVTAHAREVQARA